MKFLEINSNLGKFLKTDFTKIHQYCNFSAVLACGSYFSNYYYASGAKIDKFDISKLDIDTVFYETILCDILSTENICFSIKGLTESRLEKVKHIAERTESGEYLNVCFKNATNCGKCEKCVRTQLELFSIGKLNDFKKVFDVKAFQRELRSNLLYAYSNQDIEEYRDIIEEIKINNIEIPRNVKIIGKINFFFKLIKNRINSLVKNLLLKKS